MRPLTSLFLTLALAAPAFADPAPPSEEPALPAADAAPPATDAPPAPAPEPASDAPAAPASDAAPPAADANPAPADTSAPAQPAADTTAPAAAASSDTAPATSPAAAPSDAAAPAPAADAAPAPEASPQWVAVATTDDYAANYPDKAARLGKGGEADLLCVVGADGSMTACKITSEDPKGLGFADAALTMSKLFKLSPQIGATSFVGRQVALPIKFAPPG